uniref:Uncharacterized protein n=1 Tax=Aplanochytrium stocchinoi TaxID=215587 RepID=A0A7S3V091_9STRA|mmetsp:Transcript_12152/g.15108  ORF Transcript_12152/g.15108 Transcript_12152/m.15108 type:complete len:206 (+) Transcript_12152:158-775(+)|eukprot:CAMPEP_0204827230 /NCGR_PEP_ID=MMETSP1346-20131115/4749_1 /ASSEMBLY_ACC=CAM_ASM_000771 /TAXON_ID=215587 /ORGANISM="Aplanochytrium stocchinoi, Strain GSBS06" /LENGTH=205 /DNA_ID=CAMNT_0051955581 /DNA_START=70 /DNA_END=687 /DNA_ORIENTATION=-
MTKAMKLSLALLLSVVSITNAQHNHGGGSVQACHVEEKNFTEAVLGEEFFDQFETMNHGDHMGRILTKDHDHAIPKVQSCNASHFTVHYNGTLETFPIDTYQYEEGTCMDLGMGGGMPMMNMSMNSSMGDCYYTLCEEGELKTAHQPKCCSYLNETNRADYHHTCGPINDYLTGLFAEEPGAAAFYQYSVNVLVAVFVLSFFWLH